MQNICNLDRFQSIDKFRDLHHHRDHHRDHNHRFDSNDDFDSKSFHSVSSHTMMTSAFNRSAQSTREYHQNFKLLDPFGLFENVLDNPTLIQFNRNPQVCFDFDDFGYSSSRQIKSIDQIVEEKKTRRDKLFFFFFKQNRSEMIQKSKN